MKSLLATTYDYNLYYINLYCKYQQLLVGLLVTKTLYYGCMMHGNLML